MGNRSNTSHPSEQDLLGCGKWLWGCRSRTLAYLYPVSHAYKKFHHPNDSLARSLNQVLPIPRPKQVDSSWPDVSLFSSHTCAGSVI